MTQALYRKWRPHLWDEVVGQEHVIHTLRNAIRSERIGHAYLFSGPRGTGKTTTARLLAKAVNCLDPDPAHRPCDKCAHCQAVNEGRFLDLIEIDAASNTSVEDVRDLRDKINFSPSQGRYKVYIIDEVHMLSTAAFNALLKTLEEPPAHAIFVLATTEVHKIPATVLSRCQRHEFRRIPVDDIIAQLKILAKGEKIMVSDDALLLIARQSTGSMRDAISLLDQLASTGDSIDLTLAQKVLGTAASQVVMDLVDAILEKQPEKGLNCIHRALDSGSDPRQFARQIVDYLRALLLVRMGDPSLVDATPEQKNFMEKQAAAFELPQLLDLTRRFNTAAVDQRSGWQPGLLLELALAESISPSRSAAAVEPPSSPPSSPSGGTSPIKKPAGPPVTSPLKTAPLNKSVNPAQTTPPVDHHPNDQKPAETSSRAGAILQNWNKIRAAVKQLRPQTEGLLNSCKSPMIKNGVLVLGFASEVLKSKMEQGDHLEITHKAILNVMNIDIEVRCAVVNSKSNAAPEDLEVDGDGIVAAALNEGGKLVHKD